MWLWIDLAIALVALAVCVVAALSLWGSIRRFLRELRSVRDQMPALGPSNHELPDP
ncbi:MAG TPA: hypothetical protein VHC41_04675 [Mycobacteriales bacterium]|jgi:hypothetical protein|nr:hypothetical protein [Mycobacteriales bacterium]